MDLATAERLMSAPDPNSLSALKNQGNNPAVAKAVAGQFAALLMQNVMQSSDGAALPMAGDGIGGNIVSGLFASAVSQAAASGDKLGLADILFRAIEAKQRSAAPGSAKTEMPATAPPGAQANFRSAPSPGVAWRTASPCGPTGRATVCGRSPPRSQLEVRVPIPLIDPSPARR